MPPIVEASSILEKLASLPVASYGKGERVLTAGQRTGKLLILRDGTVEVLRGGVQIARVAEPGAVFGELAVLLDQPHTADVRAVAQASFYVVDGRTFLQVDPSAALYVAVVLAQRLDAANRYLIQAKSELAAQRRGGTLDELLDNLGRALRFGGPPL